MKKLFAILLSLCLLAGTAALAEPMILENMPSYPGQPSVISGTQLRFALPDGWEPLPGMPGCDLYTGEDGALSLTVMAGEGDLAACEAEYEALRKSGALGECFYAQINGRLWLLSSTADELQNYAQTQIDENTLLTFAFVTAEGTLQQEFLLEVLGSLMPVGGV